MKKVYSTATRGLAVLLLLAHFSTALSALDYFWVGGSGAWSAFSTHWAKIPNPTLPAHFHANVPTADDDVYFGDTDGGAAYTVNVDAGSTVPKCLSMDWTGVPAGTVWGGGGGQMDIYGSLTMDANMSITYNGNVYLVTNDASTKTIQTYGVHIATPFVVFVGSSGGWQLVDDIYFGGSVEHRGGLLETMGQKVTIAGSFYGNYNSPDGQLHLGSSEFIIIDGTGWFYYLPSQFDAGTSHIKFMGNNCSIAGGTHHNTAPHHFYDISFFGNFGPLYGGFGADHVDGTLTFHQGADIISYNGFVPVLNNVVLLGDGYIANAQSYNHLTLTAGKTYTFAQYQGAINTDQTILPGGSLTALGAGTCSQFITIKSWQYGTHFNLVNNSGAQQTVHCAILEDCHATGSDPLEVIDGVDLGNNDGWIFTAPHGNMDLYWIGGDGDWNDPAHWSETDGGAAGTCIPNGATNVHFTALSGFSPGDAVNMPIDAYCANMDWTGVTGEPKLKFNYNVNLHIYGSMTLAPPAAMSIEYDYDTNFGSKIRFRGSAAHTVTTAGQFLDHYTIFEGTGIYLFGDAFNTKGGIVHLNGQLKTMGFPMNLKTWDVNMNQGTFTGNPNTEVWFGDPDLNISSTLTFSATYYPGYGTFFANDYSAGKFHAMNSHIIINGDAGGSRIMTRNINVTHDYWRVTFTFGTFERGNVLDKLTFTSRGNIDTEGDIHEVEFYENAQIRGNHHFDIITVRGGYFYELFAGNTQTVNAGGVVNILNANCERLAYFFVREPDATAKIAKIGGALNLQYVVLDNVLPDLSTGATYSATNSFGIQPQVTADWNMTNPAPRTLFWVGGSGTWHDSNHWSLASGGAGGQCPPTPEDNVRFNAASGLGAGSVVDVTQVWAFCKDMDWTGVTGGAKFYTINQGYTPNQIAVFGSLTFSSGMENDFAGSFWMRANGVATIKSAGQPFKNVFNFWSADGHWTLLDDLSTQVPSLYQIRHYYGELTTNNFNVTAGGWNWTSYDLFTGYGSGISASAKLNLGSSKLKVWASPLYNSLANFDYQAAGNFDAGTSEIILEDTGPVDYIFGGGYPGYAEQVFHDITIKGTGGLYGGQVNGKLLLKNTGFVSAGGSIKTLEFEGDGSFMQYYGPGREVNSVKFAPGKRYTFDPGFTLNLVPHASVEGQFIAQGLPGQYIEMKSSDPNTPAVIHKDDYDGTSTCTKYLFLTGMTHTGTEDIYVPTPGGDVHNNTGWLFFPCNPCPATIPVLDVAASITTGCPPGQAKLVLAGLKPDEWANWYTDPAATTDLVYSGGTPGPAGNMFQPAITGPITYYARVYSDGGLCESTVVLSVDITITSPPAQFNMTGGGLVCSGSNGTPVGLDGSVAGVSYQLQLDGSDTGSPLAGTGAALDFGLQTAAGTYTVVATTDGTACSAVMTGSAVVTGSPLAAPAVVPGSNSPVYLGGGALLLSESGGDAVSWDWSGPGGFSSTDQNPMIANPAFADAGAYTVTVTSANGCTNAAGTVVGIYHPIAITCPDDVTMALGSGECNAVINYPAPVVTSFNGAPTVVQTSGLPAGEAFPIGLTTNCFQATDPLNYTATCCFSVTVQEYPNPVPTLVCIDMVTISLGESCQVVVTADMILDGGPYGCFNDYIVELDKLAPFGNGPWVQPAEVNAGDIGHTYQIRVIAPVSGNSCWSSVYVQDVLPPAMTCSDVVVDCTAPGLTPPAVTDCRTFTLTWNDIAVVDNFPALPHKIITRKWTATDAGGNTATCIQTVSVTDNGGPAANCPADMTVSTDPLACCATVDLPDVVLENISGGIANTTAIIFVRDPVTGDTVAQIDVPGVLSNFPGNNPNNPDTLAVFGLTPCLPLGQHDVAYLACGNAAYCTFRLTVEDNTPPVVVCDEFTTVALGAGCMVLLDAAAFDNGSYDNCSSVFFKVRRLGGNGCEPDDRFYDQMKFCAADLGQTLQIVLRVYAVPVPAGGVDAAFEESNASDCVVEVAVQDKLKPTCTAPGHVTVSCENFDPSLFAYGFATGADNCCLDTVTVTDNRLLFDSICNRGTITRTFRAFDCGGLTSTCTQRIVVNYNQNFYIKFPDDVLATDCSPSGNYGEPEFFGVDCELIGVSPEDVVIPVVPDACFKIERTWTVVNWCNYDPNLGCTEVPNPNPQPNPNHPANRPGPTVSEAGAQAPWAPTVVAILPGQQPTNFSSFWSANANCYKYTQIIKVIDSHGPVVENCPTGPVQMCDPTANNADLWNEPYWQDAPANSNDLNECPAELSLTVTDLCSGSNLTVRYLLFLDLDNDGTMETVVSSANLPGFNTVNFGNVQTPNFSGGTPRQFDERPVPTNEKYGFALQTTTNGSNKTARVRWNTQQVPNAYTVPELPYGTHKIKWFVEDACGNEAVCEYMFSVKTDCEPPIVVCNNCVSVSLPQAQTVTLGVADFLQQAQDNTTPTNLLVTAIRRAGTGTGFPANPQTSLTFGCAEIGVQQVEVWVKDEAGNTASCVSALVVGDNDGVCGAAYPNLEFCAGTTTPSAILLSGPVPGATYSWTNDNPGIGLGSGGTDYIPQFPAENFCPTPMTGTIQVQANYASAGLSCPNPPPASFTITVHPAPIVLFPGDQVWCPGETTMAIEFMGTLPGMTYAWTNNNTGIGLAANGTGDIPSFAVANGGNLPNTATITVLGTGANSPLCPDPVPTTFTITANPTPVVADPGDQVICAGDVTAPVAFAANMAVSGFSWTNDNPAIGLPASGTGDIAAFLTANNTGTPMTATITVAPVVGDKEAPTVICTNGLVANILGNGLLALYAVDFLQSAQDNVTLANQLKISIRKAGMGSGFPVDQQGNPVPYVIFDCTQTGNQVVEVWAEDACGNANFCEATVNVQAGPGVCASGPGSISGKAATEYGDGVSGVVVSLNGPGVSRSVVTGSDGGFSFNNLPDGQAYQLCLEKGSDPLNGVNSFDLVLLSQHILGVNPFNSPYTIIAGEVNESGTVTDLDIVEIRKLILHIVQDLPVPSWRFVPADHVFPNPANPYLDAIPFGCKTVQLNGSAPNQDFVAIKTADFNGSAVANRPAPAPETAGKSAAAASTSDCESCPVQPAEFTITILPQLSLAPVPASPSCNGTTDGSISANASGGTPPYQYALGGGGFQNNAVFGNLGVGTYTITVKDANGCTAQQQAALPQGPDQPLAIQCPAGIPALTADARCRATIPDYTALATLSGGCNIPLNPMVQTPAPGTLVNPGTVAITLTVSNTAGQSAKCVFNVTIGGGCGGN